MLNNHKKVNIPVSHEYILHLQIFTSHSGTTSSTTRRSICAQLIATNGSSECEGLGDQHQTVSMK